jgi:antitoxin component YwqK of YwqJK toxin-antitoxin module
MRYFIFTILLVAPLLLTAQSKKEQIATLVLRVDSLSEVLVNDRITNAQTLSDKSDKIFQLSQEKSDLELEVVRLLDLLKEKSDLEKMLAQVSQEKSDLEKNNVQLSQEKSNLEKSNVQISQEKLSLEKDIAECVDSKKHTLNALVESNSSLEELKGQLQIAQDELQKLRKDLSSVNEGEPLIVFPPSKDYTGIAKLYDEAGDLQYEIPFKDGMKEGTEIEYNERYDGRIVIRETPYKDGKKEGTEVEYNDYGDMPETATPYKNGKKEGVQNNWEGEGDFGGSSDITYVDDKVEGICVYRDHYWGTWIEEVILDGKIVSEISYDWGGGEVIWGVVYKDGEIDEGTMHTYTIEDGERIQSITIYKSGQIVSEKCYGESGNEISCD